LWLTLTYSCATLGADTLPAGATPATSAARTTRQQLVGVWRLISIDVSGAEGALSDPFYVAGSTGLIVYDVSGYMSVQIAGPQRTPFKSPPDRNVGNGGHDARLKSAAFDTYYAYFGTWSLDEATSVVTHQVTASLIPAETGAHYAQTVSIDSGGRLTLTSTDTIGGKPVVRKKVWERVGARRGTASATRIPGAR
jgi:hypothetical protein